MPNRGQALIRQVMGQAGIDISGMRQVEPRLEEAFISLIRRQMSVAEPELALMGEEATRDQHE